eukprot:15102710-Alexandrium_andersonii.AAC.1
MSLWMPSCGSWEPLPMPLMCLPFGPTEVHGSSFSFCPIAPLPPMTLPHAMPARAVPNQSVANG